MPELQHFDIDGRAIAYRLRDGTSPTLVFLPGYASDMGGAKAIALDAFASQRRLSMLRFDYSGTGSSGGQFAEGTLALWLDESLAAITRLTHGPLILIGSSMGAWIALHVAIRLPERMRALVGIAAAPDFTDWGFTPEQKAEIERCGRLEEPNPYDPEPQIVTRAFWQSGQQLRLLDGEIGIDCPTRLIHGDGDEEVPLDIAFRAMRALRSADVQLTIIKGGVHRLSQPHEIDAILRTVAGFVEPA